MARLILTPKDVPGKYPVTPLAADSADFTWTNAGASYADGAGFALTGRELLLVRNNNVAAQTITIQSTNDAYNRKGDITNYQIGAGEFAVFGPFPKDGWAQADGMLYFAASAADVAFAVLRWRE